jgi:hypothetical protein
MTDKEFVLSIYPSLEDSDEWSYWLKITKETEDRLWALGRKEIERRMIEKLEK